MSTLLYVDGCPREKGSRTRRLAERLLTDLQAQSEDIQLLTYRLNDAGLRPVDDQTLAWREAHCNQRDFDDSFFGPAQLFMQADALLIAAPYWDLSFPAQLKVWVEHLWVRNLTFHYEDDHCVGHAKARLCAYISTSGSPVGVNDWDTGYLKAVMQALGIPEFMTLRAEGLDLVGNDAEKILLEAEQKCHALAASMLKAIAS